MAKTALYAGVGVGASYSFLYWFSSAFLLVHGSRGLCVKITNIDRLA